MAIAALSHSDRVSAVVEERAWIAPPVNDVVRRSWSRSIQGYGLDPGAMQPPHVLTAEELRPLQDQMFRLMDAARGELDRLYNVLRHLGYVVLLANHDSVIVDIRGDSRRSLRYRYWGSWLGGLWAEALEGTNGIGTCIAESRAVTIHKTEHFRARHINLSCAGAPIYAASGEILGVICVTREGPQSEEFAHDLVGVLAATAARGIEERLFRAAFRHAWIIAARGPDSHGLLMAVDRDRRIIGADQHTHTVLAAHGAEDRAPAHMRDVFEDDKGMFRSKDGDASMHLTLRETGELWPATVTPPTEGRAGDEMDSFLLRPRLDMLMAGGAPPPAAVIRGGLPPAIVRRVRTYVDSRLDQHIDLKALAAEARLSAFHFARAFKQAEGVTPHRYILQRRLARARELLEQSALPLAEIATVVGFADQSHFSRRFRDHEGLAPGEYRRLRQKDSTAAAPADFGAKPYNPPQAGKRD